MRAFGREPSGENNLNVDPLCRQGDPGSTRFFLSLDDNMLRIFGGDRIRGMMSAMRIDDKIPIESKMLVLFGLAWEEQDSQR